MKELKTKIRELLPKMHFLDKAVLQVIEDNLDGFSESELARIYQHLKEVNEKTIDYFDKILQKNPRFFEQAKSALLKRKEEKIFSQEEVELKSILNELTTI